MGGIVSGWWAPLAALLGLLGADLLSGLIHWGCDTWGSTRTPILGQIAIRTFREHHVDPKSITRHDFVETNGHNIGLSALPGSVGLIVLEFHTMFTTFLAMTFLSMATFVALTSQIHKWAHMAAPPRLIGYLQKARLIISPKHHDQHHAVPFNRNFCITVGWMNGPLHAVRFFETLERMISRVTGLVPRQDDIGDEAAAAVMLTSEEANEAVPQSEAPAKSSA